MQRVVHINSLPDGALDAASQFSTRWLPEIRGQISNGESYVVVLPRAATDHKDWRRAAIRDLARAYAPVRLNMVSGGDAAALQATLLYLDSAAGVTGQYLPLSAAGTT